MKDNEVSRYLANLVSRHLWHPIQNRMISSLDAHIGVRELLFIEQKDIYD